MNLGLQGSHAVKTKFKHFQRGREMIVLFWKILTSQNHLPELVLYTHTDSTLPVCLESTTTSGARIIVWFGIVIGQLKISRRNPVAYLLL